MTRENIDLIRVKFYDWLALSVAERKEKGLALTYTDFAIHHGITRRVLNKWERERAEDRIIESGTDSEKEEFLLKIKPFALSGKNSRYADLYMKGKGWLTEKREDLIKVEFTAKDRLNITAEILEGFKRERKVTGVCPVCGEHKILRNKLLLSTESEHTED